MEPLQLALNIARDLIGRGMLVEEVVTSIAGNRRIAGQLTRQQIRDLIREVIQSRIGASILRQEGEVPDEQLPVSDELEANYEYVVVFSVECPDGSHDSYPVHITSDNPMDEREILELANAMFAALISQKYNRLAKWDVDNRTGRKCKQTAEVVEAWRGSQLA